MDIQRLKELSHEDRISVLQGEALKMEEQVYARFLEDAEISGHKDDLAQTSIMIAVLEDELRDIKATYKDKLEPLRLNLKTSLEAIKTRSVQETGIVYLVPDFDEKKVHVVTGKGDVLYTRPMKPEERQYTTTHTLKAAI